MRGKKTKLELTWIGKENRPRLEPRVLVEDPEKSQHAKRRVRADGGDGAGGDIFDNRLIFGDNLLALKALEAEFAGKIKCAYIDPPYNTGSALMNYDDGIEHSLWLSLMRDRWNILRRLLRPDGSLWVTLDDNECHYAKVVLDEVFGRDNFVATIVWQKVYTIKNSARQFSSMHDYLLVYAKDASTWTPNRIARAEKQDKAYKNPDNDARGPWKATPLHARNPYSAGRYEIVSPTGRRILPPSGTYWRMSEESYHRMVEENRIWWGKGGDSTPSQKRFLSEVKDGVTPSTLWLHSEAGHNAEAKNELRSLLPNAEELFITPKPERLVHQVLQAATEEGDIVLDSFAGSGTTGAVAHKMGRRWIMVELGDHCHTHIIPRLRKVIDGEDPGGVTEAAGWKGGGGFRYYRLAPSLLEKDRWGNWIISRQYNGAMLAEAICKLEGYTYEPSPEVYWQHGRGTESDFIYITTQTLNLEMLQRLSDEVGEQRTLAVYCMAFRGGSSRKLAERFGNLTVKKIPRTVLARCEWGKDDYSLAIRDLPPPLEDEEDDAAGSAASGGAAKARRRATAPAAVEGTLFAEAAAPGNGSKPAAAAKEPTGGKAKSAVRRSPAPKAKTATKAGGRRAKGGR